MQIYKKRFNKLIERYRIYNKCADLFSLVVYFRK